MLRVSDGPRRCPDCGEDYDGAHHCREMAKRTCPYCCRTFSRVRDRRTHMTVTHGISEGYDDDAFDWWQWHRRGEE